MEDLACKMSNCNIFNKKTTIRVAMLQRNSNSRAHHYMWSEIWRGDDTMAVVLANTGREVWGDEQTLISNSDSEEDYLAISPDETDVVPDTAPPPRFDWVWDEGVKSNAAFLSCDSRKVSFHSEYSCGTAAIRGTKELADGQHFWEIKMTSPVYGTDMMVGIGTSEVNLDKFKHSFCSLLGTDEDSWGLSYTGILQHKGEKVHFSSRFGQGSIIGLHFDTWHGTLTFYKNRRCIGVAATRLQNKKFYPMVCSTAAKSSMKVIRACYTPTSLQYLCCSRLHQLWSDCPVALSALPIPPGLRHLLHNQMDWVFTLNNGAPDQSEDPIEELAEDWVKDLKKDLVDNLPDDLADEFPVEYSGDLSDDSHAESSPCLGPMFTLSACSSPCLVPNPQQCQCSPTQCTTLFLLSVPMLDLPSRKRIGL